MSTALDPAHQGRAYTVFLRYRSCRAFVGPNGSRYWLSEFAKWVTLANQIRLLSMAPFIYHVAHVFRVSTSKQMPRVNASRIVATVADVLSGLYRTMRLFIRISVGANVFAFDAEDAISGIACRSSPNPATIFLLADIRRKSVTVRIPVSAGKARSIAD